MKREELEKIIKSDKVLDSIYCNAVANEVMFYSTNKDINKQFAGGKAAGCVESIISILGIEDIEEWEETHMAIFQMVSEEAWNSIEEMLEVL